jgi:hypothetical protein
MAVYKNIFAGLKQLFSAVQGDKLIKFPDASGVSGVFVSEVLFNQISGGTTYTGSVAIPAGATVLDIQFKSTVLWGGATAALNLGDSADADGYFAAIDLKATDLLVGEILSTADDGCWGGKNGAYVTAAGRRGTVTPAGNTGNYYGTADSIIGVITVGTPGTSTAGRSVMTVYWSKAIQTTATAA